MRPQVNTVKHIRQFSPTTVGLGSIGGMTAVNTVDVQSISNDYDVRVGAKVTAIYLEVWITSDDATQGSCVATLEKRPSGGTAMTYAQSIDLHDYPNKNNIFFTTQGLTPPNVQSGIPFVRGWFKIPKGKQRMSLGDIITFNISGVSNGAVFCGFLMYKEQY